MDPNDPQPQTEFTNPLAGVALGDPFVLRHRGRFYLYGTNDGPPLPDGRVIPVYRSDDLLHWEPLGGALEPIEAAADHWAPEVLAWNGRFYMVVSFGDVDQRGHALWVAVADHPAGPFRLERRVSDPAENFSIDGSWLLDDDGRLYLFRCLDFVNEADPPCGTGIVVQEMRDPLTPLGQPVTVLRAHAAWHLFLANRVMPLYGGRTFAEWTTIEGPAPVKRAGRYFCGYSGGNYAGAYGTGEAVADAPLGPYRDLTGTAGPLFGTVPGLVEGPGHFSVVQPDLVHDWIVLHGRPPGDTVRRVWLCPARWTAEGVSLGPLTTNPQPAPPLPTELTRFADPGGPIPDGWEVELLGSEPGWELMRGDGLRLQNDLDEPESVMEMVAQGRLAERETVRERMRQRERHTRVGCAWRTARDLKRDWVAEVYIRFLEESPRGSAGVIVASSVAPSPVRVALEVAEARCHVAIRQASRETERIALPLAEPFRASAFHRLEIRVRSSRAQVFLDGVRLGDGFSLPLAPARLGLWAGPGGAVFDAVSVTRIGHGA